MHGCWLKYFCMSISNVFLDFLYLCFSSAMSRIFACYAISKTMVETENRKFLALAITIAAKNSLILICPTICQYFCPFPAKLCFPTFLLEESNVRIKICWMFYNNDP